MLVSAQRPFLAGFVGVVKSFFAIIFAFFVCWSCEKPTPIIVSSAESRLRLSDRELLAASDSLTKISRRKFAFGQSDSGLFYLEKSVAAQETMTVIDSPLFQQYMKIGKWYFDAFKFETANSNFEKARRLSNTYPVDPFSEISLLIYLATCKREMKDIPLAKSLLLKSISLFEQSKFTNDSLLAKNFNVLSSVYYVEKNYGEAVKNIEKEIAFLKKNGRYIDLGKAYRNLSLIMMTTRDHASALRFVNMSIQTDKRFFSANSDRMAISFLHKGGIFLQLKNLDSAAFYLHRNLAIRRELFGEKHANTFGAYLALEQLHSQKKNYDSALYYSQKCIVALVRDFNSMDWRKNPSPLYFETNSDLIYALVSKANVLEHLFQADSSHMRFLEHALETRLLADSIFNAYSQNSFFDDPQLAQMEDHLIPYENIISNAFFLFERTRDSRFYEKALTAMENSRAALISKTLQRARSSNITGSEGEAAPERNVVMKKRASLLLELAKPELRISQVDSLNTELLRLNDEQMLQAAYRGHSNVRKTQTIKKLRRRLKESNTVFIEYQWSDKNIYALLMLGDTMFHKVIPVTPPLREAIDMVVLELKGYSREKFRRERHEEFKRNSFLLYEQLLQPFQIAAGTEIVVSADGALSALPFEILLTENPESSIVNYQLPYLLKKHTISYALSAGLHGMQGEVERHGDRLLGLGYGDIGEAQQHTKEEIGLPGTKLEIAAISDGMDQSSNAFFVDAEASESVFKARISSFNLVHLAVHGIGDTANALNSRLLFHRGTDSIDDGTLYPHELYDLDLSSLDMAVLSACESGVGKNQPGEGLMSIARGFAYAGCPTIVMSLWKVEDRTSAKLMSSFYKHVVNDLPVNKALAEAKIDYLKNADELTSHPSYWAAFIQVGNTNPVKQQNSFWWWVISILLALGAIFYLAWKFTGAGKKNDPILTGSIHQT
jgi:CHAT domain-containing protein/tetratricopeptide (TPR) repeat protein